MIWTEEFRPKDASEFCGPVREKIEQLANISPLDAPHMLFYGPPGVGKNMATLLLIERWYGDKESKMVTWLSAAENRGINKIRKLGAFQSGEYDEKGRLIPRLIVFDEADKLTPDAQQVLRRRSEKHACTERYVWLCNAVSKMIEPLQSRAALVYFAPLSFRDTNLCLGKIIKEKKLSIGAEARRALATCTKGDIRQAINMLYSSFIVADGARIELKHVHVAIGYVPFHARNLTSEVKANQVANELIAQSISFPVWLDKMSSFILSPKCEKKDSVKARFLLKIGTWEQEYLNHHNLDVLIRTSVLEFYVELMKGTGNVG